MLESSRKHTIQYSSCSHTAAFINIPAGHNASVRLGRDMPYQSTSPDSDTSWYICYPE